MHSYIPVETNLLLFMPIQFLLPLGFNLAQTRKKLVEYFFHGKSWSRTKKNRTHPLCVTKTGPY